MRCKIMREMKNSGIEWMGEIPNNWEIENLQWNMTEIVEKNSPIKMTSVLSLTKDKGVIPYEEKGNQGNKAKENLEEYKIAYKDTIVANSMNILIGSVGISQYNGCVSPVYYVFKNKEKSDLRFLNYIFMTEQFQQQLRRYANGILEIRLRVSSENLMKQKIMCPSLEEQIMIANYLDSKIEKINSIIQETGETIEKYKEYKQSVITQAVTKGLNSDSEMIDSGFEFIGKIPKHWNISKIKNILEWKSVKNYPNEVVLSLYREYGVIPKDSRDDNHNVTSEDTSSYKLVDVGDFVINKMKAWQGSMGVSQYRGIISPAYHICKFRNDNINKKYFHYLLRNKAYTPEFRRLSAGIREGQWDLSFDDFKNIPYVIPPIKEQEEIVSFLDKKCIEIETLIEEKQSLIKQLEDYKKSLIYECVTGKREIKE